jgi:hypothetical protein
MSLIVSLHDNGFVPLKLLNFRNDAPIGMILPEPSDSRGNRQVVGFCFLPADLSVIPYYLFGFGKFQHVLIWIEYANMTLA